MPLAMIKAWGWGPGTGLQSAVCIAVEFNGLAALVQPPQVQLQLRLQPLIRTRTREAQPYHSRRTAHPNRTATATSSFQPKFNLCIPQVPEGYSDSPRNDNLGRTYGKSSLQIHTHRNPQVTVDAHRARVGFGFGFRSPATWGMRAPKQVQVGGPARKIALHQPLRADANAHANAHANYSYSNPDADANADANANTESESVRRTSQRVPAAVDRSRNQHPALDDLGLGLPDVTRPDADRESDSEAHAAVGTRSV
ncbi:hypothetical protein B0H11DRAFT_1907160 [Mycena galericulata]|nr:hypothetical protein B0H11DRAFT_1907160 [Mycena galericulata]